MKLFKRRAKPDEIKTETLTDSDSTDTQTSTDNADAGSERVTDASSTPTDEAGELLRQSQARMFLSGCEAGSAAVVVNCLKGLPVSCWVRSNWTPRCWRRLRNS